MSLAFGHSSIDLSKKTLIMGILNVTPDSFSDGGEYFSTHTAVKRALDMVTEGADIIDVGGESTRPGSDAVAVEEESERVVPVIEALSEGINVPISIDTYKAEVARRAIEAGAGMINDISGLRFDPEMAGVAAENNVPVVIMHIKGSPKTMQDAPVYKDLIAEITAYLQAGIDLALNAGIPEDKIIIDPGIGFGKTVEHNLEIIKRLSEFKQLEMPILIGLSRKAFIGAILGGVPPSERVEGTAAAATAAVMNGANILRVHDVKEMARVAKVADALRIGGVK